jgi:hypothetical protein
MKTLVLVVAMFFAVGCVTLAWAQEKVIPANPTKSEKPTKVTSVEKTKMMGGAIVSVDTTTHTISMKMKSGKTETLNIDPKITVKKAGKTIVLTDLSAGEKITASYKTKAGKKIATKITVRTLPAKKELGTKKETAPPKQPQ